MVEKRQKNSARLRQVHNADLIRRMVAGEPLNAIDNRASWYPPRPIIKKDAAELARVYGTNGTQNTKPGTTHNDGAPAPAHLQPLDDAG